MLPAILGTLQPHHEAFIGMTPSEISAFNPELMTLIGVFVRGEGVAIVGMAISGLFILNYSFRKKEKWAWYVFVILLPVFLIPALVFTYAVTGLFGIPFLLTVMANLFQILALAISYRDFFK